MRAAFRYAGSLCDRLREHGVFNMLLTDGEFMLAYSSTDLHWITRRSPFGKATLIDTDVEINFRQVTAPNDVVTVIATNPLTANEDWNRMDPGECCLFHYGHTVS